MPVTRAALHQSLGAHLSAEALDELLHAIEEAWPTVTLDADRFAEAALRAWDATGRTEPLAKLALADLYLARACLDQDPLALEALDVMLRSVAAHVARSSDIDVQDVTQRVRQRLLVAGSGEAPKLSLYRGRGALMVFLRVVSLNVLRNMKAPLAAREAPIADVGDVAASVDLESRVAGIDRQRKFREAFRVAVLGLSLRERSILRLNLLEGLSIDDLAPMYRVHRSTMARWLADAKQALATRTKDELATGLQLSSVDAEHLLASLQGQFDLTLSGVLRETAGDDAEDR